MFILQLNLRKRNLNKIEEEAKRSNVKGNQAKGRNTKIEESYKSDHSDHKKRRVKALAKVKEAKEEVKESPVIIEKIKEDSIKEEFNLKSQQNITVGNISSVKGSSSGENLIQKFAPKAFKEVDAPLQIIYELAEIDIGA